MKKLLFACAAAAVFGLACGNGGGTSDGGSGTGSGGTTGSSSSSGGTTGGGAITYCDGFGVQDSSAAQMVVETYSFSGALKTGGCYNTMVGYEKDAGGFVGWSDNTTIQNVGGIYDINLSDNYTEGTGSQAVSQAPAVIFPGGCDDMGLGSGTNGIAGDGGMNFTAPSGASTVAEAVTQGSSFSAGATVWGVVTAIYPWTGGSTPKSGSFYIQDVVTDGGMPAPASGIAVYVNKANVGTMVPPSRGDVVTLSGFTWSPYDGHNSKATPPEPGFTNKQNQLASTASSAVIVIGTAPLPAPVPLPATQLSPTQSTSQYFGMRVTATGAPFTVKGTDGNNDCPPQVENIHGG